MIVEMKYFQEFVILENVHFQHQSVKITFDSWNVILTDFKYAAHCYKTFLECVTES